MTERLKASDATIHEFYEGTVVVKEFNFECDSILNDADITLTGRYPSAGYAVNDISTALISVEEGEGSVTIKDTAPIDLATGDRLIIKPGEPYFFSVIDKLAIRYIATPAWTPSQARIIE